MHLIIETFRVKQNKTKRLLYLIFKIFKNCYKNFKQLSGKKTAINTFIKWLSFIHGMIIWKSLGKHKLIKVILKLQIDKLKIHIEIAILLL